MTPRRARGSGDLLADRRYAYAADALAEGDAAAAADLMRQTVGLVPAWVPAWMLLAAAEERLGRTKAAAEAFARAAALDADGLFGATLHLARLRGASPPDKMPDAYVAALFDGYAERFDRHLVEGLGYRGPALLAGALARHGGARRFARALDLGCGTGLMGEAVRGRAERLEGVDLSAAMVAAAARKDLYDALHVGEVARHLGAVAPGSLDLILAADVFVYLGTLDPVLAAAAKALAPGGVLAFTVQTHEGPGVRLGADLRFSHGAAAVRGGIERAGLAVAELAPASTRREGGADVPGLLAVARAGGQAT